MVEKYSIFIKEILSNNMVNGEPFSYYSAYTIGLLLKERKIEATNRELVEITNIINSKITEMMNEKTSLQR